MLVRSTLFLCVLGAAAPAFCADPTIEKGWVVSARAGLADMQESISGYPNQDRIPYRFTYEKGPAWSLAASYRASPRWRGELELTGRHHRVAGADSGRLDVLALMGNVYFDLRSAADWSPYIGAGVGVAWMRFDDYQVNGAPLLDGRAHARAWQGIAGLRYRLDSRWQATLDYRYFRTTDPLIADREGNVLETSIINHAIMLGITHDF